MSSTLTSQGGADSNVWVRVRPGLVLDWSGPSIFERPPETEESPLDHTPSDSSLQGPRPSTIIPSRDSKKLRFLRQLGPRQVNGSVWLCETHDNEHTGDPWQVVLKLFSPDLYNNKPSLEDFIARGEDMEAVWHFAPGPEIVSFREAMAYSRLRELQGVHIPFSYGFYRFNFPVGTLASPVLGHVSEYIDAHEPHFLILKLVKEGEGCKHHVDRIMQAIFEVYRKIHAEGVAHQDVGCRNMRLYWNSETNEPPRCVVFDFERAQFGQDPIVFSTEEETMNEFLMELGAWTHDGGITDWVEGPGKLLYDDFAICLLPPRQQDARRQANLLSQAHVPSDSDKKEQEEQQAY